MAAVEQTFHSDDVHPIDIVESLAEFREWSFDRVAEDRIAMTVEGGWRSYSLTLAWSAHDESLRLLCTFEMAPPDDRAAELALALDLANDQMWTGCFNMWRTQGLMVWRHGLILAGGAVATAGQVDAMVRGAVEACERFYPAFQLVAWGGESAERAMGVAIGGAFGRA
jgi:hypothetical protein